jgi:hypothetical protein
MRIKPSANTRNGAGYGYLWVEGKMVRAHRLAYAMYVGAIPDGQVIRHTCDRPHCVNPEHLRAGTQSENVQDTLTRRRHGNQWRKQIPVGHRDSGRASRRAADRAIAEHPSLDAA